MERAYIHPSHDVELFWDVPDPHNPAWQCRFCHLTTCNAGCPPGKGLDDSDLMAACAEVPAGWKPPLRPVPLKVVLDEIAAPPGEQAIRFNRGTGYLPGVSAFQSASGSITFTYDACQFSVPAKRAQDLTDQLDELTRKGRQAAADITAAIQAGVLSPVSMAVPDEQDEP